MKLRCVTQLEVCTGMGMAGIPVDSVGNLQKWVQLLWEYGRDSTRNCGNATGMEFIHVGTSSGCFGNFASDKSLGASFGIPRLVVL